MIPWNQLIVPLLAVLTAIGSVLVWMLRIARHLGKLELQVDTMWMFLTRRAVAEGNSTGLLKVNSPVSLSDRGRALLAPFLDELRGIYASVGAGKSDAELMLEIERRLGERIVKDVCIPNGIHSGACLVAAVCLAKETPQG